MTKIYIAIENINTQKRIKRYLLEGNMLIQKRPRTSYVVVLVYEHNSLRGGTIKNSNLIGDSTPVDIPTMAALKNMFGFEHLMTTFNGSYAANRDKQVLVKDMPITVLPGEAWPLLYTEDESFAMPDEERRFVLFN